MQIKEKQTIEKEVTIETKCNNCGCTCTVGRYQSFDIDWGYYSNYDMQTWFFDLCEDCLTKLSRNFVIPVDKKDIDAWQ